MKQIARAALMLLASMGAGSGTALAQSGEWYASGDVLWVTTYGDNVQIGSEVRSSETDNGITARLTRSQTPIAPQLDRSVGFLFEVGRRTATWGFGGRAWRIASDVTLDSTLTSTNADNTAYVHLWNESLTPLPNNLQPSGQSPVTFGAGNDLEHLRVEGFAERSWFHGPMGDLAVRFGLSYARSQNARDESVGMIARSGTTTITTDDITIRHVSESDLNLAGPMVALVGDSPLGPIRFAWLISPSALIGTAKTDSTFTLTDVFRVTNTAGTVLLTDTVINELTEEGDARALVPAIDLQVKASYPVTGAIEVGGAVLSSTLFGMPAAPVFDMHNLRWTSPDRNVTFVAYSAFARVRF